MELGQAAIAYARHGLAVFPLKARDKVPATAHGVKDATRDEATITTWWELDPDANIGIAAGSPSGVVVLDVDGESGEQSLIQLMEKHGALPMTPAVATGKGFHLYFRMPEVSLANRVAMAPGLDLRSTGGYVVAPPSIHPSGRVYDWQVDFLQPFAAFPHWLEELAHKEQVASEIHVDAVPEGQRNDTLFRDASAMRRRGMGEEAIRAALMADPRYNSWTERERRHELDIVLNTVLKYPAGDPEADANEAWKARQKAKQIEQEELETQEDAEYVPGIEMVEVRPENTWWLWRPYFPAGKLVILDGDPGLGKSTLLIDLAARWSRGYVNPDGSMAEQMPEEGFGIIVMSVEDGLADTVQPRLVAQGAKLRNVRAIVQIKQKGVDLAVTIPEHIQLIERAIKLKQAQFMVIDPLMAVLSSDVDAHKDQDIRAKALQPLKELAERTGCTIAMIRHLNKVMGGAAVYRGGGSIGIIGATRSAMIVGKDYSDPAGTKHVFAHAKSNLARLGESWAYSIESPDGDSVGKLVWAGKSQLTADQLVMQDLRTAPETAEAVSFIRDMLVNGPMTSEDIKQAANGQGISWSTLEKASKVLKVKKAPQGMKGQWVWSIPGYTEDEELEV